MGRLACSVALSAALTGLGLFALGCGAAQDRTRPATQPEQASPAAPGRSFAVTVDESNLLLPDEGAARDYLRRKLVGLLSRKLMKAGFDGAQAARLAAGGHLGGFAVRGHEERVAGQGSEAGLIKRVTLWDVKGALQVGLSDEEVAGLLDHLGGLELGSMEQVDALERFLERLDPLGPDPEQLATLRRRVGDRWSALLAPWLKIQLDIPLQPAADYLAALERTAHVLADFRRAHPEHPAFEPLEKTFTLAALKILKTIPVQAENFEAIQDLLGRLDKMAGQAMPGLLPYLKRDLELAWRDHLVALDDAEAPFEKTRRGFLAFLELFPKSRFYPDLELRFLSRWYEKLIAARPADLAALEALQAEVDLLAKRFPRFQRLAEVRQVLGQQCVRVLAEVEVPDLAAMGRVKAVRDACEPCLPAGMKTVEMRDRLERIEQRLLEARDDRLEKQSLADLTFFIDWDQAVQKLPWGGPRADWPGSGPFAAKWAGGVDAGADCRCSLDPDEPCRAFEQEGPAGGFEVVARFYRDRLLGVDLCGVFMGERAEPIFRFFARRYEKAYKGREVAAFLTGAAVGAEMPGIKFVQPGSVEVTLERSTDTCTIRYRSLELMAQKERDERAEAAQAAEQRQLQREQRIRRGWRAGACVRWDCTPVCRYSGRVRSRGEGRYRVTITRSREDAREQGTDVWVREAELTDCR